MNSERGFIFCMLLIGIELHYSLTFSLQHLLETHPEVPPIPITIKLIASYVIIIITYIEMDV